jgi:N-acetylmuramoyl-L-alanine amidase
MKIHWRPSPHFSKRGKPITAIVLHCDASAAADSTIAWLQNPASRVSYHFLVGRTGNVYQFVKEADKAWHAGASEFAGERNCNDYSLGLAFSNTHDGEIYTHAALAVMGELCRDLIERYEIPKGRITTHAAVAPGRKTDPCPPFDLITFLEGL